MNLYFLRHGAAGEASEWRDPDSERPLTDEGKRLMAKEALVIAGLELDLEAIISSKLLRAVQTAQIVAEVMGLANCLSRDERLGPGLDSTRLAKLLSDSADKKSIMLVGHEPGLSRTIGALIGGTRIELKKGSLACIKVADPSTMAGELAWLLPPKFLTR